MKSLRVLLITPPLVQSNTPYPATPFLLSALQAHGIQAHQTDLSIALLLDILSVQGLTRLYQFLKKKGASGKTGQFFLDHFARYRMTIGPVIRFLQDRDPTLAVRIAAGNFLPAGPRFAVLTPLQRHGVLDVERSRRGVYDHARFLASLYIDDLADCIQNEVDPRFGLSRYAQRLCSSLPSFEPLARALSAAPTLIDERIDALTVACAQQEHPDFAALTVPFPGTLYAALRIARCLRRLRPGIRIALGGGYVSTELRSLDEPALFDYVDYVCLDDGSLPLRAAIEHAAGRRAARRLVRCFTASGGTVHWHAGNAEPPDRECAMSAPCYTGLPLDNYFSVAESVNPMHTLWSNGRWNKLMLAHGCYWRRCRFCDTSLDYIKRYAPQPVAALVGQIREVLQATGQSGFHFVDEAAPPALLAALSRELEATGPSISWWGNIRFEKFFTPRIARVLAQGGCIAVSGGLEAAHDGLLASIDKGITVAEAAGAMHALASAGILVHAYLMYGLPRQSVLQTVDSLECVRQLFAAGCLHSAFWHRFSVTVHSDIGHNPQAYGIRLAAPAPGGFACNDVPFDEPGGVDHDLLGQGLRKALYNYMLGVGLEEDVRAWFDMPVPRTSLARTFIRKLIGKRKN